MKNLYTYGIIAVLVVALLLSIRQCDYVQGERRRLDGNQRALLSDIERYKFRDSLNAASVQLLTMKVNEFDTYFGELSGMVRDMGIKLKRVENISQTALESSYQLQAQLRDTTIIIMQGDSTRAVEAQSARFADPHITFNGVIADGQFYGDIETRDTLFQVIHRVPRQFLFFRWGIKELRQEIIPSSPYSRITYNRTLKIE